MPSPLLYNLDSLIQMVDGDEEQLSELNQMFMIHAPQMLEDINEQWEQRNFEKLGAAAHKFKSSIRLWQIDSAVDLILTIEINAKNKKNIDSLPELIASLNTIITTVLKQMQNEEKIKP